MHATLAFDAFEKHAICHLCFLPGLVHLPCAAEAEAGVLKGMRSQARVIVSTLGNAAAGNKSTYNDLYGSFIVWVGE